MVLFMRKKKSEMDYAAFFLITGIFCVCSSLAREFHYIPYYRTWPIAQKYCRARFSDMATIESLQEVNSTLQSVTSVDPGYKDDVWIGLKRSWGWHTADPLFTSTGWGLTEPNYGTTGLACGTVTPQGWSDQSCSINIFFFCYDKSKTGNGRFTMIQAYKNWFGALAHCRQYYTDLAIINNTQDQQFLTSFGGLSWIGLIPVQWSDKTISQYRYWKAGQLEYTNVNNCVAMDMADTGKWNSTDCELLKPFVCYGAVDKMRVNKIVRVVLTSDGVTNLNDPSVQAAILSKIEGKVKERVMNQNVTVWWKVKNDGSVFKKIIKT
ncbi:secretory phospholipase A2 receptor-like [Trichomycterus rosablanca]|uniref:secretory phospholipase A2 receptor-like n=1 Tax=Trichomycterus rosablanca TaxID=2290929 RepID=UPI002F359F89